MDRVEIPGGLEKKVAMGELSREMAEKLAEELVTELAPEAWGKELAYASPNGEKEWGDVSDGKVILTPRGEALAVDLAGLQSSECFMDMVVASVTTGPRTDWENVKINLVHIGKYVRNPLVSGLVEGYQTPEITGGEGIREVIDGLRDLEIESIPQAELLGYLLGDTLNMSPTDHGGFLGEAAHPVLGHIARIREQNGEKNFITPKGVAEDLGLRVGWGKPKS